MSNNISKKIFAIVTSLTMMTLAAGPGVAQALTTTDLQAQIAQLTAQLAQLQSQLSALQGSPTGIPAACVGITFTRNLSRSMSGNDVKCLQALLNQLNVNVADSGAGSPGNETTYFGGATRAAVIRFQELYKSEILTPVGLTVGTGYVGSKTIAKLNSLLGAGGGGIIPTGAGLNVSIATDNPVSATIVADSATADGAQALIPFLKVRFTNGDSSAVKVTQIKFTRSGISADVDLSQAYLYDGMTQLAQYSSFTSGVLTFNNSAGLFTIPAGASQTVTLKADLTDGTASGKQIRFGINANTDVVSNSSAITGVFPITGNYMVTAQTSDLGKLSVATTTGPSAAIDPQSNVNVFGFSLKAEDQNIQIQRLMFTNIGSTANTDLANFKLYVNGVQVGSTIASMNTDKTVIFDLSASPIAISKGVTLNTTLQADIVAGTNRTFQFEIANMTDILAYDTQYGVYLKPNKSDSWTVLSWTPASTISTGKLTFSRATDSPSGNVVKDGTNVTIAKFNVQATGEDAKISSLYVEIYGTVGVNGLYQGKILLDGNQVGTATNLVSTSSAPSSVTGSTQFTFGNNFVVPADGAIHTVLINADIKTSAAGSFSGGETLTAKVATVVATGRTSSATISVGDTSAFQLTVSTGSLSTAKYGAIGDWSASNPTAVPGQANVLVGAFVITAGAAEGANITSLTLQYTTTTSKLSNLKLYNGNNVTGTQIGNTQSSVSAATNYTFYPSPYVSLAANQQIVLTVYADVQTGMSVANQGYIQLGTVTGYGAVTNSSVSSSGTVNGQLLYFSAGASLTIAGITSDPVSSQVMMGSTGVTFTKVKFSGATGEPVNVTKLTLTGTLGLSEPTSTIQNIILWDLNAQKQIGSAVAALNATTAQAVFDLSANPWVINPAEIKTLAVKADINTYAYAQSGGTLGVDFATGTIVYQGAVSGSVASNTSYITGNVQYTYKTTVSAARNSGSPSGSKVTGSAQQLLWFDVANQSSVYSAYFNAATFTLAYSPGNGSTTFPTTTVFSLYDLANLSTPIGLVAVANGTTINTAAIQITASSTLYGTAGFEIPAGQTKTFVLVGPTNIFAGMTLGSTAGSKLEVDITPGTNFYWGDGLSTLIYSTLTKGFPLYGNMLTY